MERSSAPQARQLQTQYLTLYNLTSALLWLGVLGRVLLLVPVAGFENVYDGVGQFAKWTQTLALLEVLHSAIGVVRSPLPTTLMQVSSRLLLVWAVVDRHPDATAPSPFYSSMLLAWSVTEVIRYSYFTMNLANAPGGAGDKVPAFLVWLRYNTFFVLYPLGIASEMALVWKASGAAGQGSLYGWGLWAVLAVYFPGAYVLYSHMMVQRRKVLRGKAPERRR